jgi:membrane-associated phospholipid phosphatase
MSAAYISTASLPRRPERPDRPGPATPLLLAGLFLLALVLTWAVAEYVPAVQFKDAVVLHDFTLLSRPHVNAPANVLLKLLDPLPFTVFGIVLVAVALIRGRWRVAVAVALVMAMAPLTAELLKPLLAHAHDQLGGTHIADASWPSGHSTAAAALVLCAALVSPARLRPLVAMLGALFALAVGVALLILAWHMPSDVIGGYLLAAVWMALAVAGLRAGRPGAGQRSHTAQTRPPY